MRTSVILAFSVALVPAGALAQASEMESAAAKPNHVVAEEEGESIALEEIKLMLLDVADQRAVLRLGEGLPWVVKPQDSIPGTRAIVESVGSGKLVVIFSTPEEPPSRVTAWIYQDRKAESRSRVQYLDPRAPPELPSTPPRMIEQIPEGAPEPTGPIPPPL